MGVRLELGTEKGEQFLLLLLCFLVVVVVVSWPERHLADGGGGGGGGGGVTTPYFYCYVVSNFILHFKKIPLCAGPLKFCAKM